MECLENHGSDHAPGFAPLTTIPILLPKAPCRDTIGMTSRISNPHDLIFKHLYSNPQAAAEFLRHNMPKAMAQAIDFSTLTPIKDSFVGKDLRAVPDGFWTPWVCATCLMTQCHVLIDGTNSSANAMLRCAKP